MCEPYSIAYGVMMAVTTAVTISESNKTAKQNARAQRDSALLQIEANKLAAEQVKDKHALEEFERRRQAIREEAKLRVAAGESGIAGNTPARQIMNVFMQEGFDLGIMEQNMENQITQNNLQQRAIVNQGESAIAGSMAKGSYGLNAAMQIGSSAAQGAALGQNLAPAPKTQPPLNSSLGGRNRIKGVTGR